MTRCSGASLPWAEAPLHLALAKGGPAAYGGTS